jgi:short-chain Z-isoprenyl diphosphate synthase
VRNLLYRLYERSLENSLTLEDLPRHIGVILDGNRRWAERKSATTTADGHAAGAAKVIEFLGWCQDIGVNVVTLYLLSTDNLTKRESKELLELMDVIAALANDLAKSQTFKLQLVGDREALPKEFLKKLEDAEKLSKKSTKNVQKLLKLL